MLHQYRWVVLVFVSLTAFGVSALAQRGVYFREGGFPTRLAPPQMPDGNVALCRLAYTRVRSERSGIGWETDYPYAEINLTTRLSELTTTRVSRGSKGRSMSSVQLS